MLAIGQLAGGIAHDFNNLLTVILGHTEFLLRREEPRANSLHRISEIRKAAQRGAWLTSQLLAYSRNPIARFSHRPPLRRQRTSPNTPD